jgi:hypothetical protein
VVVLESTDRIRRAQGLALAFVPVLTDFKPKIEADIIQEGKLEPPDEVLYFFWITSTFWAWGWTDFANGRDASGQSKGRTER